ncbi:DUF4309 domain-containing protein [Bacillus solitudinis]|uniref:DUF4309 domain-containing protein n=1 Tax=Bacillus solitudinis TaxID=2014074 RepID=UPI000C239F46|nr:DUF4309 domain-containing protein [Bacillus solitudinis]
MSKFRFFVVFSLLFLSACGQGEIHAQQREERDLMIEKQAFLSFSWIEQGFYGIFEPLKLKIGTTSNELIKQFGDPENVDVYEGGIAWIYDDSTFLINSETKKVVASALNIKKKQLTTDHLKKALGTPDLTELDEMDGYLIYYYYLDDYELSFETDEESGSLIYAWFKQRE